MFELGLRGQQASGFNYSLTIFHDGYEKLRAGHAAPTTIDNLARGPVFGAETWLSVDLTPNWRLSAGGLLLREELTADATAGASSVANLGDDPRQQLSPWSTSASPAAWTST